MLNDEGDDEADFSISPCCSTAHRSSSPLLSLSPPFPGILSFAGGPFGPGTSDWPRRLSVMSTCPVHSSDWLNTFYFSQSAFLKAHINDDVVTIMLLCQTDPQLCIFHHRHVVLQHLSIKQYSPCSLLSLAEQLQAPPISPVWGQSFSAGCQRLVEN